MVTIRIDFRDHYSNDFLIFHSLKRTVTIVSWGRNSKNRRVQDVPPHESKRDYTMAARAEWPRNFSNIEQLFADTVFVRLECSAHECCKRFFPNRFSLRTLMVRWL